MSKITRLLLHADMSFARQIVRRLLGETGEADQDYDHEFYDEIVRQLEQSGISGAIHQEFDNYQGVYLRIPGIDTFWTTNWTGNAEGDATLRLIPEDNPNADPIAVHCLAGELPDISDLMEYIQRYHSRYFANIATKRAQADAENFMDQALEAPKRRPTRPGG
jgi:hypothetical protein